MSLQLGEREHLAFPQCVEVKDSDSRLLSLVCNSSIAFVGTDSLKEEGEGDEYRATEAKERSVKERGIHMNIQSCRDELWAMF